METSVDASVVGELAGGVAESRGAGGFVAGGFVAGTDAGAGVGAGAATTGSSFLPNTFKTLKLTKI